MLPMADIRHQDERASFETPTIYDGGIATLGRFQDDVKEVRAGVECGIKLGDYTLSTGRATIECSLGEGRINSCRFSALGRERV